jgi:hypothetical protein
MPSQQQRTFNAVRNARVVFDDQDVQGSASLSGEALCPRRQRLFHERPLERFCFSFKRRVISSEETHERD